jgi:beta-glucanase (GH16 family)
LNEYIHAKGRVFMVAAILPNVPNAEEEGQTYGRYAVRFKADPIDGYKMAWLLWPDSARWPRDGEIDFPERNLDSTAVSGFVHHQGARQGSDQTSASAEYDSSAWHTAVIEWSPDLVVFTLDGVEIGRITERIPRTPMHWVLQTETQLTSQKPPKSAAGNVQIDWVAVWQYDPTAVAPPPVTAPAPTTTASRPAPTRPTGTRYRVIRS